MKSIITLLIHLLGGITLRESEQSNEHCLKLGSSAAYRHLKAFADLMVDISNRNLDKS